MNNIKIENLIGKRFGNLLILNIDSRNIYGVKRYYAHVTDSNGKYSDLRLDNLIRGNARKSISINKKNPEDCELIGTFWGNLEILHIYKLKKNGRSRKYCTCRCTCGKIINSRLDSVIGENGKKSCGCKTIHSGGRPANINPSENLINKTFNRLTVISYAGKEHKKDYWNVQCNCPLKTIKKVRADKLKSGATKSCGCLSTENNGPLPNSNRLDATLKKRFSSIKSHSKRKGIAMILDYNQYCKLSIQPCHYCGEKDIVKDSYSDETFKLVGLDRIFFNKGYTVDNIVPCCKLCNLMKNKMNKTEFLSFVGAIAIKNSTTNSTITENRLSYNIVRNKNIFNKIVLTKFSSYKSSSTKKNFEFKLTKEFISHTITQKCYYCGCYSGISGDEIFYNGLDRLNNSIGYTPENVVSCCLSCNKAKRELSKQNFLNHIFKIHHFQKQ